MTHNLLVLCHGMTIALEPSDHAADYDRLLSGLYERYPDLESRFSDTVRLEYGHETPHDTDMPLRPDERLTRAQRFIRERISYARISRTPSPEDELLPPRSEFASLMLRKFTNPVRDTVVTLGLSDALYYASPDGEQAIRHVVYSQILDALDDCDDGESELRLHVIAHSLGATVMFDFLFGLFAAPDVYRNGGAPDLVEEAEQDEKDEAAEAEVRYARWRQQSERRDQAGRLKLGSLVTLGGQIPFFFMRKQALIDRLAENQPLEPEHIGIPRRGPPAWKVFYDVDDMLGYPVRGLFEAQGTIRQYQVDTHHLPHHAHARYWQHDKVLGEVGALLERNTDVTVPVGIRSHEDLTR